MKEALPPKPKRRPTCPWTIRRAQSSDAPAIARIFDGPRAVCGTVQLPYSSAEQWQQRLSAASEAERISLLACVKGEPIGILGLHLNPATPRRRHAAELGMTVRDDWQGRGVGTALVRAAVELADDWLQLRRISLNVYVDNEPAIRLYRRFGFEVEGTQRDFAFRAGRYVDALLMARLHPQLA